MARVFSPATAEQQQEGRDQSVEEGGDDAGDQPPWRSTMASGWRMCVPVLDRGIAMAEDDARIEPRDGEGSWGLLDQNAAHGWDLLTRAHLALEDVNAAAAAASRALERAGRAGLELQSATAQCCCAAVMLAGGEADAASRTAAGALSVLRRT
jgi:hypothetical protein